jgi:hypothetical protein
VPVKKEDREEKCRKGEIAGAFCFDDTWYATREAWEAEERNEKNA